jgi:hypothetical protein
VAEDVGGDLPRRMAYLPATGKVWVKKLRNIRNETIIKQETTYREICAGKPRARAARSNCSEISADGGQNQGLDRG